MMKVRIIAGTDDALSDRVPPLRLRGDYAALLKRGRAARAAQAGQNTPTGDAADLHGASQAVRATAHDMRDANDDRQQASLLQHMASYAHLPHAAYLNTTSSSAETDRQAEQQSANIAPYLDALAGRQYYFLKLVNFLVERMTDFCTDPAVLSQGHWEIRIPLDPALLPACTLYLQLSHFDLILRFETVNASSQRLISDHSDALQTRLEALLANYGAPRPVEISIV